MVLLCIAFVLVVLLPAYPVLSKQDGYMLIQERINVSFANPDYIYANATMRFIDRKTKGIQMHFVNKESLAGYVMTVIANKWINGNYVKYSPIQFVEPMKNILAYKSFDLQSLFLKYTTPKAVYPMEPAHYYVNDWVPDYRKFPPYIPSGKYMMQLIIHREKERKTKMYELQWHLTAAPIIKW